MSRFCRQLSPTILLLSIAVLIVAGGVSRSKIPEEAIGGKTDRASDELIAEETQQKKIAFSKESKRGGIKAATGKRPDWVEGRARKYPAEQYLTGVGFGDTRRAAEDLAYAAIARIFQAQISSRTKEWEKYVQTEIKGKIRTTRDIQIDQLTSVATKKALRDIRIAEIWVDESEKSTYALAIMDRAHAAAVLRERIAGIDRDVLDLRRKAKDTTDKVEAVRSLRRAMRVLLKRDLYNIDLRIVNPVGKGVDPPVSLINIRQEIQRLLSHDIHIGIEVSGPYHAGIRSAILEGLTKEGFSLEESGDPSKIDVLVKGNVNFKKADLPRWKIVRWSISVDLINHKNGKIFGSLTKHGREAHLNFSEAEKKAVRALQKKVVDELGALMVSFIYGQEEGD